MDLLIKKHQESKVPGNYWKLSTDVEGSQPSDGNYDKCTQILVIKPNNRE